jgi:hypothetical protein
MVDAKVEKFVNLNTDSINEVCRGCKEKCKQSCNVTVVYCPNKTNKKEKE